MALKHPYFDKIKRRQVARNAGRVDHTLLKEVLEDLDARLSALEE